MFKQFSKQFLESSTIANFDDVVRVVNVLQTNIADSLSSLISKTQNDSTVLTNVSLSSTSTTVINHTLGRKLSGWRLIRNRANSVVWDDQDNNSLPNLTLRLNCSASTKVDIEVW